MPNIQIPVILDNPPAGSPPPGSMEALNWNGIVTDANNYNLGSVPGFMNDERNDEEQAGEGTLLPPFLQLHWKTVSWKAFAALWATENPVGQSWNPNVNLANAGQIGVIYVQPGSTAVINPSDNSLSITPPAPPAQAPASPLGLPIPNYPGLRYAAKGDTNPDYFIYPAPDGTRWQRETVIMLGPIYQQLPG